MPPRLWRQPANHGLRALSKMSRGIFKIGVTLKIVIFLDLRSSGVLEIAPFSATIIYTLFIQSWDSRQDTSLK